LSYCDVVICASRDATKRLASNSRTYVDCYIYHNGDNERPELD